MRRCGRSGSNIDETNRKRESPALDPTSIFKPPFRYGRSGGFALGGRPPGWGKGGETVRYHPRPLAILLGSQSFSVAYFRISTTWAEVSATAWAAAQTSFRAWVNSGGWITMKGIPNAAA